VPPFTVAQVGAVATALERNREHPHRFALTNLASYNQLNTGIRYLWLLRDDGAGYWQIMVAPRGANTLGHPTLAFDENRQRQGRNAPVGAYRAVLVGGEMRYGTNLGQQGWILDNESGRFGLTSLGNAVAARAALQFALDLFQFRTGQTFYGDVLNASAFQRNLQLWRRNWGGLGTNYLSTGFMTPTGQPNRTYGRAVAAGTAAVGLGAYFTRSYFSSWFT
jgi:hypothetical protein